MDFLSAIKAIAALAFVLGLLLGGTWLLRKYGSRIGLKTGAVESRCSVSPQRTTTSLRRMSSERHSTTFRS